MDNRLLTLSKAQFGPGGLYCSCCNPAFGKFKGKNSQENRKAAKRAFRRTEKISYRSAAFNEMQDIRSERLEEYAQMIADFALEIYFEA